MSQKSEAERRGPWFYQRWQNTMKRMASERLRQKFNDYRALMTGVVGVIPWKLEFISGSRRWGFLFSKYAFKFPKPANFVGLIAGFREQLEERYWWCSESGVHEWGYPYLNRIIWADRFGFIQISERCNPVIDEPHFDADLRSMNEMFKTEGMNFAADGHLRNFGYTADGRLVFVDYGFFRGVSDCYLGCPNGFSIMRGLRSQWWKVEKKIRRRLGRSYGVRIDRNENEQCVAFHEILEPRLLAPDLDVVRIMLGKAIGDQLEGAGIRVERVERVGTLSRATHITRPIMAKKNGLPEINGDAIYWRVTETAKKSEGHEDE